MVILAVYGPGSIVHGQILHAFKSEAMNCEASRDSWIRFEEG